MLRYSPAIALNFSCQTRCAGIALDLSLIVTRVLPCARAHSNAARMIRATPLPVLTSSAMYSSPLVRPRPKYWPSVFSRKITKSISGWAVRRLDETKRSEIWVEQLYRSEIDIQVETETQTKQNIARVFVARDAG